MKMTIAKLKKSTIVQKAIAGILTSSIALFSAMPVYAGTTVDQESLYPILKTSTQEYLYPVTGTTNTIYRYTTLADVLSQFAEQSTLNQKSTYTLLNTIKGYVDGIEGYVDGIEGYVDGIEGKIDTSNTHLNAIKGYVDGLETLVTTSNTHLNAIKGYVDGIEGKIDTSNTRLNDIKSAIENITTYNYTSILTDIQTNMLHVPTIDQYVQSIQDSIGYGNSVDNVLSNLNSVNGHLGNIYSDMSYWDDSSALSMGIAESTYRTFRQLSTVTPRNWNYVNGHSGAWASAPTENGGHISKATSSNVLFTYWIGSENNNETSTISTDNMSLVDYLYYINNGLYNLTSRVITPRTYYNITQPNYTNGQSKQYFVGFSLMDTLWALNNNLSSFAGRMGFVLADDDTISAKNANNAQEQAVLTNFTGQGSASASASDFGELSSAVSSVKSGLNTNASPSDVLTVFNSDNGFGWFSQATLDELDTTTQNTRTIKGGSNTPLYDSNYNAIMEYLTGGEKK